MIESHCGTDFGLLRTRAEPLEDGSHRITGCEIFISAGDHDLTANVIHLVLARLRDAPKGVKKISLSWYLNSCPEVTALPAAATACR